MWWCQSRLQPLVQVVVDWKRWPVAGVMRSKSLLEEERSSAQVMEWLSAQVMEWSSAQVMEWSSAQVMEWFQVFPASQLEYHR